MALAQDMIDLINEQIRASQTQLTSAATVVRRTGATTALVTFDGSALAVPVKVFGDVNIDEGDRVGLVRLGVDWTVVGTFTRRRSITMPDDATTGTQRAVFGANTPPELASYGIATAVLFYVNDVTTGLEVGYFFIGQSNRMDAGAIYRALVFGNVTYPTAGMPSSATAANVKTNFQMNHWAQARTTVFKDHDVQVWTPVGAPAAPRLYVGNEVDLGLQQLFQFSGSGINAAAHADTMTSATNVPTSESAWNFRKQHDDTRVRLSLSLGSFVATSNAGYVAGISINGTSYDVTAFFHNVVATRGTSPTGVTFVGGIPAGDYTPFTYWRRSTGTGTLTRDVFDWINAITEEVGP
jgi:hypothetical protein